ncbi:proteobacterial dedicated sortase system response regulator [Gammaproteobacteria bacterium 45_16_T64]|nr:proteobacterial dedicated sortase system response regulator [Gammaproteobacteria bacterium 45_16_T64]
MNRRIAIVEDEQLIRENYREFLEGYGYHVDLYGNRIQALEAFSQKLPDLAIIDIGLENEIEGGFDLCRELRQIAPNVPIMFLTARDSELDAISGLRLGADDYLTKDISLPHLGARIIALFRRIDNINQQASNTNIIERGSLLLDIDRMIAAWNDAPLDLTLTEFWMIHSLAKHPGHVKNRQQLMDAANAVLDDNTITSHVKRIRKKFQSLDTSFDAIQTVYGIGYRWHDAS